MRAYVIYVVVGSIVEDIEAHPQDSLSLPSVRSTKNGDFHNKKKRLRVDRNIYVCLSRNVLGKGGAAHPYN